MSNLFYNACYCLTNKQAVVARSKIAARKKISVPSRPQAKIGVRTGYISGEPPLNADGLCEFTVDNTQHEIFDDTSYSVVELTLYKVHNGNTTTTRIDAADV